MLVKFVRINLSCLRYLYGSALEIINVNLWNVLNKLLNKTCDQAAIDSVHFSQFLGSLNVAIHFIIIQRSSKDQVSNCI